MSATSRTTEPRRAALCVGVSQHTDPNLDELPAATESAKIVAKALSGTLFGAGRVVTDPATTLDLFEAVQKAIREARGGALFFYYSGWVLERDGDLLLAVKESDTKGPSGCVPWSDIEDLLKREGVARAIVVLNGARRNASPPPAAFKLSSVLAVGALHRHDPAEGGAELVSYAETLARALGAAPDSLEEVLDEGLLDGHGLDKYLARNSGVGHVTLHPAEGPPVLRDLREELAKAKTEKAEADKRAEEKKAASEEPKPEEPKAAPQEAKSEGAEPAREAAKAEAAPEPKTEVEAAPKSDAKPKSDEAPKSDAKPKSDEAPKSDAKPEKKVDDEPKPKARDDVPAKKDLAKAKEREPARAKRDERPLAPAPSESSDSTSPVILIYLALLMVVVLLVAWFLKE